MKQLNATLCALSFLITSTTPAVADEHERSRERNMKHPGWHGEIERFHEHDFEIWRGGRWYHGRHDGRMGWWWLVGNLWYFYPYPVYPYPDPYQPPAVLVPGMQPQYWYYCADPAGYYPYIAACRVNWQLVPASPPPGSYPPPR
ncbi:MAG TPA: hypothetical protein VFP33_03820 [Gallionella sp.]|nr:hypothetical protein [Gallionella sp.]